MDELFARYGIDAESPEAFVRLLRQLSDSDRAELETELAVHANYALDAHMQDEAMDVRMLSKKIDCFVRELQPYRQYLDMAIKRQENLSKGTNAVIVAVAISLALTIIGAVVNAIGNAGTDIIEFFKNTR